MILEDRPFPFLLFAANAKAEPYARALNGTESLASKVQPLEKALHGYLHEEVIALNRKAAG